MPRLSCPVPGCTKTNIARQTRVQSHLRDFHGIKFTVQQGGNMSKLRPILQREFSEWLGQHGHPKRISLFADVDLFDGISEDDEEIVVEKRESGKVCGGSGTPADVKRPERSVGLLTPTSEGRRRSGRLMGKSGEVPIVYDEEEGLDEDGFEEDVSNTENGEEDDEAGSDFHVDEARAVDLTPPQENRPPTDTPSLIAERPQARVGRVLGAYLAREQDSAETYDMEPASHAGLLREMRPDMWPSD